MMGGNNVPLLYLTNILSNKNRIKHKMERSTPFTTHTQRHSLSFTCLLLEGKKVNDIM